MLLETPALLIDGQKLQTNIDEMASYAAAHGFALRPHIKAHRLPPIARLQRVAGAAGFTCAKIGEAEMMAEHQFDNLLIAYQVIGQPKLGKLHRLLDQASVILGCDSLAGAQELNRVGAARGERLQISLEVDSGLHRCGILPGRPALELAQSIRSACPHVSIVGVFTHAGQSYAAPGEIRQREIAELEARSVVETAVMLQKDGFPIEQISVGSTPTARFSHLYPGVTEIRPGNYVFYDATQVGLGVVPAERCALTVLTTVISRPAPDRLVVDAGSKVLGLDKGAHGVEVVRGYGIVVGWPNLTLERLSEEHGVLVADPAAADLPRVGDQLQIIPNHACPVVYRADKVYYLGADSTPEVWPSAMRGSL
jgi:D-serine deaminase-like pyridoxal phosphate-dependent protein